MRINLTLKANNLSYYIICVLIMLTNSLFISNGLGSEHGDNAVLFMTYTVNSQNELLLNLNIENTGSVSEGIIGFKLNITYNSRYFSPTMENGSIFTDYGKIKSNANIQINMDMANKLIILFAGSERDIIEGDGLLGTIKFKPINYDNMPIGAYTFDFNKNPYENEVVDAKYSICDVVFYGVTYMKQGTVIDNTDKVNEAENVEDQNEIKEDEKKEDQSEITAKPDESEKDNNNSADIPIVSTPEVNIPPAYIGGGMFKTSDGDVSNNPLKISESEVQNKPPVLKKLILFRVGDLYMRIGDDVSIMEAAPFIKNSRVLLPIRYLAEALDYNVDWIESERKIIITKNDTTITLVINDMTAYVNGEPRILDAVPEILEDRTFVPLRFIAEELSGEVRWEEETKSVYIES